MYPHKVASVTVTREAALDMLVPLGPVDPPQPAGRGRAQLHPGSEPPSLGLLEAPPRGKGSRYQGWRTPLILKLLLG